MASFGLRHLGLKLLSIALAASVSFACINTLAKYAAQGLHTVEVTWGRYFFSLLFLVLLVPRLPSKRPLASARPVLHIGRSALLLGVTLLFFAAIPHMPLVDAVAIGQTTPLIVTARSSMSGPSSVVTGAPDSSSSSEVVSPERDWASTQSREPFAIPTSMASRCLPPWKPHYASSFASRSARWELRCSAPKSSPRRRP